MGPDTGNSQECPLVEELEPSSETPPNSVTLDKCQKEPLLGHEKNYEDLVTPKPRDKHEGGTSTLVVYRVLGTL